MPDIIDATGLQVKTAAEITTDLSTGLRDIYGADINLDQNSPDGQMVGIITQAAVDIRELAVEVNAGFDPDQAVGVVLDQRVTINNIARTGGTYTIQPITIIVDRTVDLQGLDANFNEPLGTGYTVQDNAGNQFILVDSDTLTAGSHSLDFRAKTIGAVNVPINTITSPVTIVLGVTSVNNPSAATTVGQNEETDAQLRTRRERSVALASFGYLDGLNGTILNLEGVTECKVYENRTNATDGDGIPAHSIWAVVAGGANSDIANAIYSKISYGAGMKGDVEVTIANPSGTEFVAKFSRPVDADLYIQFTVKRTIAGTLIDETTLKQYLVDNLVYGIGDFAETATITEKALMGLIAQGGGAVPLDVQISDDDSTWVDYLDAPTIDAEWGVAAARIDITVI